MSFSGKEPRMRARTELTNSDIIRGSRLTSSGVAAMNHSCRAGRRSSCCSRCRKKPAPMCGFHCTVISGYYSIRPHVTAISFSTAHGASRFPRRKVCTKKSKQCCAVGEGSYVPHGLRATAAVRLIELGRSEDLAAAVTGTAISTSCVGMYAVPTRGNWPAKAMRKLEGS